MKKFIIGIVLLFIGLTILFSVALKKCADNIDRQFDKPKEKVGKTYVVNKDTVIVMDYSLIHSTYSLSNGQSVAFSFIDSLKPVK